MNVFKDLEEKFTSGNSIPVTESTITLEKWVEIKTKLIQSVELINNLTVDTHCFDDDTQKDVWSYSENQIKKLKLELNELFFIDYVAMKVNHEQRRT